MRLLITRPLADSEIFARVLAEHGHEGVVAPVMEVRTHVGPPAGLEGVQGVLATSANGVRALAARSVRRDVTIYAVGPQTAEAATSAGFSRVYNAEGDAKSLAEFVANHANPSGGKLLHAAGEETAGRLRETLKARGFEVETIVLYGAAPVAGLPAAAAQALREGTLNGVMLFSPRSAIAFTSLVAAAGLSPCCRKLTAFCISAASAAALSPLTFAREAVAETPNQEAMLALLPPREG